MKLDQVHDRRLVLGLMAGAVLAIVLVSVLAPGRGQDDPLPTTFNSTGPGAKAAYLLLAGYGYRVERSERRAASVLDEADAAHTTYILAEPFSPPDDEIHDDYAAVERFLRRGGRVLATGLNGAYFLPGGRAGQPTQLFDGLCYTVPEAQSRLARVGSVATLARSRWTATEPAMRVDQYCGNDAVVMHQQVGSGEAVWWSSAEPLSNRGIRQNSSLQLLLTSIDGDAAPGQRRILFDEYFHDFRTAPEDYLHGLPLRPLAAQAGIFLLLLALSFSRRSGPLRESPRISRSSPVEFAESMGALYERAETTEAATGAARRRFLRYLEEQCGFPAELLRRSAAEIAEAVHARFGIDTTTLQASLERAEEARLSRTRPRDALRIVQALDAELARLETHHRKSGVLLPQ